MKILLFPLALLGGAAVAAQPTVDQVLEKYAQAIGGQAAYEKVTTRIMKGSVEIPDDNATGTAEVYAKAPGSYRSTMNFPGYGVIEAGVDGEKGWERNPDAGLRAMSRADLEFAKRDHHFYRELRLKELYPKMEMAAAMEVNGRSAYVITATPAGGPAEKFYFDAQNGLLVKHDYERVTLEDGIVQYEVFYSDYREVDGIKVPYAIEQRTPDSTMILKFVEVRNNAPVEDALFQKPAK
jgi:outer membrane lipoprotein-sorting protein